MQVMAAALFSGGVFNCYSANSNNYQFVHNLQAMAYLIVTPVLAA